jgi:hypothetical protein
MLRRPYQNCDQLVPEWAWADRAAPSSPPFGSNQRMGSAVLWLAHRCVLDQEVPRNLVALAEAARRDHVGDSKQSVLVLLVTEGLDAIPLRSFGRQNVNGFATRTRSHSDAWAMNLAPQSAGSAMMTWAGGGNGGRSTRRCATRAVMWELVNGFLK